MHASTSIGYLNISMVAKRKNKLRVCNHEMRALFKLKDSNSLYFLASWKISLICFVTRKEGREGGMETKNEKEALT